VIYYRPTDGGVHAEPVPVRPRTCFLMTQLGRPAAVVLEIRTAVQQVLLGYRYAVEDADARTTGRDFLLKIWHQVIAVPMGIAIIHEDMPARTLGNIFYELGLMQAYGKETVVVKTPGAEVPSDFVRTEHIVYGDDFPRQLEQFMDTVLALAEHFGMMAELVEHNPLLAIDYYRRAYLISGDETWQTRARDVLAEAALQDRARNSVESLMASFIE
jgi:hypothetical protein